MLISEVHNAFKIADVKENPSSSKLDFNYLNPLIDENGKYLPSNFLNLNVSRVYLIVVNNKILKIGGSQDKGGMKGTLQIYRDGGVKGRPSIRSFGVWYYLNKSIKLNKKVEFYMIYSNDFVVEVKGLNKTHIVKNGNISCKLLEECCLNDYRNRMNGLYPDWNIQEQGKDWEDEIKKLHTELLNQSLINNKSKRRKQIL
jgi:hypothetical protein